MEAVNPWTEMREYLRDWIVGHHMNFYPDNDWGDFDRGYLQALDEVLDYVAEREEQDG